MAEADKNASVALPACKTCGDTHKMPLGDREVPCTFCPRPCEECRSLYQGVRLGAYCEKTPCACRCHPVPGDPKIPRRVGGGAFFKPHAETVWPSPDVENPSDAMLRAVLNAYHNLLTHPCGVDMLRDARRDWKKIVREEASRAR